MSLSAPSFLPEGPLEPMPRFENVLYETRDGIAYVTVNRPKALNALDTPTWTDLRSAFEDARDDVDVDMRNALAHPGICGHERAVRGARGLDGDGQPPDDVEEGADLLGSEVVERLDVRDRHHEGMSEEERAAVEERDDPLVTVDDVGRDLARHDAAEHAARVRLRHAPIRSSRSARSAGFSVSASARRSATRASSSRPSCRSSHARVEW